MRALVIASLLLLAVPAAAQAGPPHLPDSTRGTKFCGSDVRNRSGGHFKVYVTKGERLVSCRRARSIVRRTLRNRGWRYYDWTKGGNGPWSDVWRRHDHRAIVAAIITCVDGLDDDDDLPPCHESRQP